MAKVNPKNVMETVLGGAMLVEKCDCCADVVLSISEPFFVPHNPGVACANLTPMMTRELIRRLQRALEQ